MNCGRALLTAKQASRTTGSPLARVCERFNGVKGARPHYSGMTLDQLCAGFPATDLGLAERFLCRFGHDFRYVIGMGWQWRVAGQWQGPVTGRDRLPPALSVAIWQTVRAIQREAAQLVEGCPGDLHREMLQEVQRLKQWGLRLERASTPAKVARMVQCFVTIMPAMDSAA